MRLRRPNLSSTQIHATWEPLVQYIHTARPTSMYYVVCMVRVRIKEMVAKYGFYSSGRLGSTKFKLHVLRRRVTRVPLVLPPLRSFTAPPRGP